MVINIVLNLIDYLVLTPIIYAINYWMYSIPVALAYYLFIYAQ